jgi:arylsulfatase A-like enzyme
MSFRSTLLISISLVAFGLLPCAQLASATDPKPNIILIMVDDLGYADISPYGQREIQTPKLAKLAKRGMTFTQFYAGVSVCAPSRSLLMEGLHTGHNFIRGNKQNDPVGGQGPIPEDTVTIAKVFKEAGYVTGMIGKWGLGNPGTTGDPLKQGWDFYFGYTDQVLAHNCYPDHLLKNGEKVPLNNKPVHSSCSNSGIKMLHSVAPKGS